MSHPALRPVAAALALSTLLVACGGQSETPTSEALAPVAAPLSLQMHALAAGRPRALAVAITNEQLFAWAQRTYPALFGTAAPQTLTIEHAGKTFDVRFFAATGNYLGVANGEAFGLGPFTGNALQSFGAMQQYAELVCANGACGEGPGGGGTGGTGGSLNDCAGPAWASLPTGYRTRVIYAYRGIITGDQTIEAVIDGNATFEGQTARQITAKTNGSNTAQGITVPITTVLKSYQVAAANGLVDTLGSLIDSTTGGITIGGFTTPDTTLSTKVVFDPPEPNSEFTLALGGSLTKTTTSRSTTLASSIGVPAVGTTITSTGSVTHTYEARESVTVPAGTYSTCRYRASRSNGDATVNWFIVGKGLMVKSEVRTSAGTQVIELKSGTLNGAPI